MEHLFVSFHCIRNIKKVKAALLCLTLSKIISEQVSTLARASSELRLYPRLTPCAGSGCPFDLCWWPAPSMPCCSLPAQALALSAGLPFLTWLTSQLFQGDLSQKLLPTTPSGLAGIYFLRAGSLSLFKPFSLGKANISQTVNLCNKSSQVTEWLNSVQPTRTAARPK